MNLHVGWVVRVELLEKLDELGAAVAVTHQTHNLARGQIDAGQEADRAEKEILVASGQLRFASAAARRRMGREVIAVRERVLVPVIVERYEEGVLAYNDDLRASASGADEAEAMANFRLAVEDLIEIHGDDVLRAARPIEVKAVEV